MSADIKKLIRAERYVYVDCHVYGDRTNSAFGHQVWRSFFFSMVIFLLDVTRYQKTAWKDLYKLNFLKKRVSTTQGVCDTKVIEYNTE